MYLYSTRSLDLDWGIWLIEISKYGEWGGMLSCNPTFELTDRVLPLWTPTKDKSITRTNLCA